MAKIREELTLSDRFSGVLDKFIEKLSNAASKQDENRRASQRMTNATAELVDELSVYEGAVRSAFTDSQFDAAMAQLEKQMQRVGLVWTSEAAEMAAADSLMNSSLRQLAQEGALAANSMAEEAYATRQSEAAAEGAAGAQEKHTSRLKSLISSAGQAAKALLGMNRAEKTFDGLDKQLRRFALSIFSVSRIIQFLQSSLERAPQSIQDSWSGLQTSLNDLLGGAVVSALQTLQPHIDRLNAALQSEAGQKFARGLESLASFAGEALGALLDVVSGLIEFLGDHFQEVMTVAAVLLGIFAAQMLATAAASLAASWPIILIVGLVAALITGLMNAGVTSEEIFRVIGEGAGWLYAFVYNLVADAWNIIALFAEFLLNVFNDPLGAVVRLFFDVFDAILGIIETVAGAIDALFGTDWGTAVSGFRDDVQKWADDKFGENEIQVDRMDKISYTDTMKSFGDKAVQIGNSLSDFSLSNMMAAPLSDISDDTSAIRDSVAMSEEDLKSLVDMAEREYVNNINLTAQTPVITVNGANTGNTAADRQNLADALAQILEEQRASSSLLSTARTI